MNVIARTHMIYCGFLFLVLVCTAALVLMGRGEFKDFQWAAGLVLAGIGGLVQEPPRRHPGPGPGSPAMSIFFGLLLCGLGACDGIEMGVRIQPVPVAVTTTEQLTLSPPRTPHCPGAACLAQGPSGRVQVVQNGGDTLEIGEARSVRLQHAAPPRPAFGDLYANPTSGTYQVYGLSGWDKLCLLTSSAGTYTNATLTVGADGRLSVASGASAGVTTRKATIGDNGASVNLAGTNGITGGRVVGWCQNIATAGGAVINVAVVSVIWDAGSGIVDTTGDTTSLTYSYGGGYLGAASAPLVLGFHRDCHYQVIPPGT